MHTNVQYIRRRLDGGAHPDDEKDSVGLFFAFRSGLWAHPIWHIQGWMSGNDADVEFATTSLACAITPTLTIALTLFFAFACVCVVCVCVCVYCNQGLGVRGLEEGLG